MSAKSRVARGATDVDPSGALESLLRVHDRLQQLDAENPTPPSDWLVERGRLLEERALLRAMIDEVPDYLFVKDRESRFLIANRAVAADRGSDPTRLIGKTDVDLHPSDLAEQFMDDEKQVMVTGAPMIDKEEFVILPSGERRWLSTSKLPLKNDAGEVIGLVGVARDITQRKRAEDQVRFLAYFDPLTRLPNRARMEANLRDLAGTLVEGKEARLALIDLDRFKQVNDTLGHAAGDGLLRSVAERLSRLVEKYGIIGRMGGDEFIVIASLPDASHETSFYDTLVSALAAEFVVSDHSIHVGGSVGITAIRHGTNPLAALREADIALYEAKKRGRGRWQAFEPGMALAIERRHLLEGDLRRAIEAPDQLFVLFQPVYSADGQYILGAEALVRWKHPRLGVLSPDEFIPVAEESGTIPGVWDIVLRNTCELLSQTSLPWAAVNVSPVQLHDAGFAAALLKALGDAGLDPTRLQVEITEGVLLEDTEEPRAALDQLRAMGVRVALDDFGTGYSSLSYLERLALDKIKVDRSFVARIGNATADAIVRAVIAFAQALNMTVTAEGVETEEQRRFLDDAGCGEIQGYLLSRPLAVDALLKLLET